MLDNRWYTEIHAGSGSAFSLEIENKIHDEQSQYQHIEVYETRTFGRLMVIDDCVMLTSRDNFIYHEMMSHFALFSHPSPEQVLIIGGGDCGTLREVLKHPSVKQATQIDIDERVTRVSEQYFPELCEANNDPRAHLAFEDGIAWVKRAEPDSYDVIIVDSTDPVGPGEVLFTTDFYTSCLSCLKPDGIIVQQSESPLLHKQIIDNMLQRLKQAGFQSSKTITFPQPVYPSGWWSATLAKKAGNFGEARLGDISSLKSGTDYYNEGIHQACQALPQFFLK